MLYIFLCFTISAVIMLTLVYAAGCCIDMYCKSSEIGSKAFWLILTLLDIMFMLYILLYAYEVY